MSMMCMILIMLPLSMVEVEGVSRGPNSNNPDFDLKHKWRRHFGSEDDNTQIPMRKVTWKRK